MEGKTDFVDFTVKVNDQKCEKVVTNIFEILDGEDLDTLQDLERIINYYMMVKAGVDTIDRSLATILFPDEKKVLEQCTNYITESFNPELYH